MANTELIESGKANRLYAFVESMIDPIFDDGGPKVRVAYVIIARQLHLAVSGDYTSRFMVGRGDQVEFYIEVISENSRDKDKNTKKMANERRLTLDYIFVDHDRCRDPKGVRTRPFAHNSSLQDVCVSQQSEVEEVGVLQQEDGKRDAVQQPDGRSADHTQAASSEDR